MTKQIQIGKLYKKIVRDTKEERIICVTRRGSLDPLMHPEVDLDEKLFIVWFYYLDKTDVECMTEESALLADYDIEEM